MITLLEARNFRMLRHNSVALRPFHVLVGQNATGKRTFLSALQFISDGLKGGVESAVEKLAPSFYDLCFWPDQPIELAVELEVPDASSPAAHRRGLRYELEIGIDEREGLRVLRDQLFILPNGEAEEARRASRFELQPPIEVLHERPQKGWRKVVGKTREGRDYFRDEKTKWNNVFRFGLTKPALGSLPEDPDRFALSIATRNVLRDGLQTLALDAREMRLPAPPGGSAKMALDGSNLPYVVRDLKQRDPVLFEHWLRHVAIAVEGLRDVDVRQREDDKHLVLEARFDGEHRQPVPSWLLSDGTLRLMALTLLSYAAEEDSHDVYLIEEPENGLHPLAIQVAFETLSQPSESTQFLCASHSPILLSHTRLEQALVFRRTSDGFATVQRGDEIDELREWSDRNSISDLFVTGVLA